MRMAQNHSNPYLNISNIQDYLRCWAFCRFFWGWLFACNFGMVCEIDPLWICLKCDMRYTPNPLLNHHVSYEFRIYLLILGWMKWLVACSNFRETHVFHQLIPQHVAMFSADLYREHPPFSVTVTWANPMERRGFLGQDQVNLGGVVGNAKVGLNMTLAAQRVALRV